MRRELYVGNISDKATEDEIRKLFSVAGAVTAIHLITDPKTGKFMGCGYVKMANGDDAKEAVDTLDGALLVNRVINVSEARPQKPKEPKFDKPKFGKPRGKSDQERSRGGRK